MLDGSKQSSSSTMRRPGQPFSKSSISGGDDGRITLDAERIAADYSAVVEAWYSSLYATSLVRPDGYVTIASTGSGSRAEEIRRLLARQTRVTHCEA